MFTTHYNYILQGCHLGKRLKDYLLLSEEIMSQSGIGFNDTNQKGRLIERLQKKAGVSPNTIKAVLNKAGFDETTSIHSRAFGD
jgi:hypothetical protein